MSVDHSSDWDELAALHALGALEDDELTAFTAHLRGCERCANTVARDRETLRNLSLATPETDASPGLREKLLARARAEMDGDRQVTSSAAPPAPIPFRPSRASWFMPLAAVLVAALAVAVLVASLAQQGYNQQIVASVELKGQATAGSASVLVRRSGSAELRLQGLGDPPAGHVYEAWIIAPNSAPQPAGTLAAGQGTLPLGQGQALAGKTVAITVEPAPGQSAPSQTPIFAGAVSG